MRWITLTRNMEKSLLGDYSTKSIENSNPINLAGFQEGAVEDALTVNGSN